MNVPESLEKQHQKWIDVVNNGNIDAYANIIAKDAVWIPLGQQPIIGRKAFKQWLVPFFGKFSYAFLISEQQFIVSGDWAFERAKFTSKMTPDSGGEPMTHSGTFTVLWYRAKDKNCTSNGILMTLIYKFVKASHLTKRVNSGQASPYLASFTLSIISSSTLRRLPVTRRVVIWLARNQEIG